MGRFENKVVVMSGTSSGIGRTTAKMFAAEGAKVVGIARRQNLQMELEAEIAEQGGIFVPYCGDVTKEADVNGVIETAIEKFGRIDILVNDAGDMDYAYLCADVPNETWEHCLAINMTAPMMMIRKALSYMLKQENGGNIVNVGSVASIRGTVSGVAYVASKHGLVGITQNVAYNYANQKIRCNQVCPGGVDTYMCSAEACEKSDPVGFAASSKTNSLMIRMSQPEEIAEAILFLASDASGVINGVILAADSGFTAC